MPVGRKEAFSIQLLQLIDASLVAMGFVLADMTREEVFRLLGRGDFQTKGLPGMAWVLYVAIPFTPLVLEMFGFYRRQRTKKVTSTLSQLVQALLLVGPSLGLMLFFARLPEASRFILLVGGGYVFILLLLRDRLTSAFLKRREVKDHLKERVLIAASREDRDEFLKEIDPEVLKGLNIVDRFDLGESEVGDLYDIIKAQSVERVILVAGETGFDKVAECVEACELQGVEAWVAASFMRTQVARPTFDVLGDKPMLVLRSTPDLSWALAVKEVFDRVVAFLIILVTLPLWIFAWIGIRITSPGPAFYFQKRAGKYGLPFRMWKFRTMVPDADRMLEKIKEEHGNQMEGPVFKLENDPRIFKFGALLRKLSIDELPQLLNVLMGDMSLVGPRPLPLYEVEAFQKSEHRRRLSVKPGITCEWQCGGRNSITSFEQWVEMDLRYIDNWSFWLDLKLLLRTIPAVLFGRGAK
jgi:exopolysaccharide biosynthesis polyprenyl glycosylphosphotransferase